MSLKSKKLLSPTAYGAVQETTKNTKKMRIKIMGKRKARKSWKNAKDKIDRAKKDLDNKMPKMRVVYIVVLNQFILRLGVNPKLRIKPRPANECIWLKSMGTIYIRPPCPPRNGPRPRPVH